MSKTHPQKTRRQVGRTQMPPPAPDLRYLQARAADVVELLRAMSNPTRMLMLQALSVRENTVAELQARTPTSQSVVSRQLKVLREARIVTSRRTGRATVYRLVSPAATAVIKSLDRQDSPKVAHSRL